MGLAGDLCLLIVAAWVAGLICHRLGLPIVLGYIAAGVTLSPYTWGPSVHSPDDVETLADIGVGLLLFTVGLEFPLPRLSQVGKVALLGAPLQVILTCLWGVAIGWAFGWPLLHGVWFGALLGLSSTAVVLRCLTQNGYMNTLSARVMIGILVLQDLCSVPMLVVLPRLGSAELSVLQLLKTLLVGILFVMFWLWMGRGWLPRAIAWVAGLKSREMFTLTILAAALGIGYSAWFFGLSLAFGAFLAGLVLAESDYGHQALADVTSLRDVFTLLFFASVGLLIEPHWLWAHAAPLTGLLVLAWGGKALILAAVVRSFGYGNVVPWAVATYLGQMGELAFVLARLGSDSGAVPDALYKLLIAVAAVSMTLTPLVATSTNALYITWRRVRPRSQARPLAPEPTAQSGHTIVVGYGRVGRLLAATLTALDLRVVVVEHREAPMRRAQEDGFEAIYGEADALPVLEAAGLHSCQNVILTFADAEAMDLALRTIREVTPDKPVLLRASSMEHLQLLQGRGERRTVLAEIEGALELTTECLEQLGRVPPSRGKMREVHYHELSTTRELVEKLRAELGAR